MSFREKIFVKRDFRVLSEKLKFFPKFKDKLCTPGQISYFERFFFSGTDKLNFRIWTKYLKKTDQRKTNFLCGFVLFHKKLSFFFLKDSHTNCKCTLFCVWKLRPACVSRHWTLRKTLFFFFFELWKVKELGKKETVER